MRNLKIVTSPQETAPMQEVRAEELRILEAMLFASAEPLDEKTLAAQIPEGIDLQGSLLELQQQYASRGVNLVRINGKWTFRTASDLAWLLSKETTEPRKLSRAAIETLAIIAYHQPVTRLEIENIRGVTTSKGSVDVLLETAWIRPRGRRKSPGRPITYGTTEAFCRTSAWTRSPICPAWRSSEDRDCWTGGFHRSSRCPCPRMMRLYGKMRTR